jgi:hypothetical protein
VAQWQAQQKAQEVEMGCDIHWYVEHKAETGEWVALVDTREWPDPWTDEGIRTYRNNKPDWLYSGRNYDLFAILADVRNGFGVAGVDTGERFNPIHEERGLPDDVTPGVRREHDEMAWDAHSASWCTLEELEAFDWQQVAIKRGYVDAAGFAAVMENRQPPGWWSLISPGGTRALVSNEEMVAHIKSGATGEVFTKVSWQRTYQASVREFYTEVMPGLRDVAERQTGGDATRVRAVYWFDN